MMKVLLIGSEFVNHLQKHLTNVEVVDTIFGHNPMEDGFSERVKASLEANRPDMVIVDMMMCASWLYQSEGSERFFTLSSLKEQPNTLYNPAKFQSSQLESNLKKFIKIFSENYKGKVFLVESALPKYSLCVNQFRNIKRGTGFSEWFTSFGFIKEKEKYFLKKVNPTVISLSRYYFVRKQVGKEIDFRLFEDELYEDINRWILEYLSGENRTTPSFDISVKRFINYQNQTIHYKAFESFLSKEDFTDHLMVSGGRSFAIRFEKDLILLKHRTSGKTLQEIEETNWNRLLQKDFCKIVDGFAHSLLNPLEQTEPERCFTMFRNGVVSSKVKNELRNYWVKLNRNLINTHNAGYYYAKMMGMEEKEAVRYAEPGHSIKPVLMDVYGSCISYQPINEFMSGMTAVVHNNYYMHVPCYESSPKAIPHPTVSFENPPLNEFEKNVRLQFDHKIEEDLKKSEAEWCIIDLFSLVAPRTFLYNGFCFTDYGDKTWRLFPQDNIEALRVWNGYYQKLLTQPDFFKKIDRWIDWMNERYGQNIITMNFRVCDTKIGDDNKLYYAYSNANKKEEIIQQVYQYIQEKLNGYLIDYTRDFLADDAGYSSSSSVHYELDFYTTVRKTVEYIVSNKPEQHVFSTYPNNIRVERMLRLREKNSAESIAKYFKQALDRVFLPLPYKILKEYKDIIIGCYDAGLSSIEQVLKKLKCSQDEHHDSFASLIKALKKAQAVELGSFALSDLPKSYALSEEQKAQKNFTQKLSENICFAIEYYSGDTLVARKKGIYGVKDTVLPNPEPARRFIGWKGIRQSDGFVWCINEMNKRQFRAESDAEKDGFHLLLAPEGWAFKKLSNSSSEIIRFYAQYEDSVK